MVSPRRDTRANAKDAYQSGLQDYYDLKSGDYYENLYSSSLDTAIHQLKSDGVKFGEGYSSVSPEAANVLVTEAVNLAAKAIDYNYYELKPKVFVATAIKGADKGVSVYRDDDDEGYSVWRMYHPEVGSIGFHDPYGEIEELIEGQRVTFSAPYEWSGIYRQDMAFEMLDDTELVKEMAEDTAPEFKEPNEVFDNQEITKYHDDTLKPHTLYDHLDTKTKQSFVEILEEKRRAKSTETSLAKI